MEVIGIIIFIWIVFAVIAGIVKAHRQKIRDQIAHDILDNIDLQKEKEGVVNMNQTLNLEVDKSKCPRCGSVLTNHRQMIHSTRQKKVYGGYLRCGSYPQCKFQKQIYPIDPWEKFVASIK